MVAVVRETPQRKVRPKVIHEFRKHSGSVLGGVRELTGFRWQARHDREFAFYSRVLQLAWRTLPDRVLLIPLARNRIEYEKLVRLHRSVALESFAPPPGRCPAG